MDAQLHEALRDVVDSAYATFTKRDDIALMPLLLEMLAVVHREPELKVLRHWRDTLGAAIVVGLKSGRYTDFLAKLDRMWLLAVGPDLKVA